MGAGRHGQQFRAALKKIFEDELVQCFYRTYKIVGDAPHVGWKDMGAAVKEWKAANKGESLTVEGLSRIMPKVIRPLTLDTVKQTFMTRNAEAATEKFLQRDGVARELLDNPLLKKRFLHDIRSWIADGAYSHDTESSVQQLYHDALTTQYQESLRAAGTDVVLVGKVRLAAMQWWADNDAAVLTTGVLRGLHTLIEERE